ncbi:parallel beta-helix repeat (two copies) [Gemmobacter megaterium]|uniref:Parallel beta-helix repeat (Two copies) n=1 Tax=Gemmobacter megaterium TaxID=1086013 RepID=A0A1N7QGP6_9RHOB|nr:right-handed parallel beta-helix repeat-containing protein [Gemmobacter megaterium]GGE26107.1 hypothetical protein GCM10011345_35120 [Gemmobacter megaterium]SIT22043.1 parallel beta-helix repeat (two copies) [Gemmobacter megaterium]
MSATILVSTLEQLHAALAKAKGGETILLEPGHYERLTLNSKSGYDIKFPSDVTITSADPDNPASFGKMNLDGAENVVLQGVVFDYRFAAGDTIKNSPFVVQNSSNIQILDSEFRGDVAQGISELADGFGTAVGLTVTSTTGMTLDGNEFHSWHRGLVVSYSYDVAITGNEVHDIRSDGMNFVAVQGVEIEGNHIHSFRASRDSKDHADMIQFWTNGTKRPSTDIVIRDNILDIADGSWTQSIFMRNEVVDSQGGGKDMYYKNVLIENNTIYNSHIHGITVGEADGLTIRNNSLIRVSDSGNTKDTGSGLWTPAINVKRTAENVEITGNITSNISGHDAQPGWVVKMNAFIQDSNPYAPGYYGDVFINSTLLDTGSAHAFVAKPGGMVDLLGAGSSLTQFDPALAKSQPLFDVAKVEGDGSARLFDASLAADLLGKAAAQFLWTFSDGTTASGPVVAHSFAEGGQYTATLTIKLSDGRSLSSDIGLGLSGNAMLSFDAAKGAFTAFGYGQETTFDPLAASLDGALKLGSTGVAARVASSATRELRGSDDFEIAFSLQADKAGNFGEVFRMHGAMVTTVNSAGQINFQMSNTEGKAVILRSDTGVNVSDGKAHDVVIRFVDGKLSVTVDGKATTSMAVDGTLPTGVFEGLAFGNAWGKANFVGKITAFDIMVDVEDYTGQSDSVVVPRPLDPPTSESPDRLVLTSSVTFEPDQPEDEAVVTPTPAKPADPPQVEPPVTGGNASAAPLHEAGWTGHVVDIAGLKGSALRDDARVASDASGAWLVLDGDKDYAVLQQFGDLKSATAIGFSVDFSRDPEAAGEQRLIWNHQKIGLTVNEDSLMVTVATADNGFRNFAVKGLEIDGAPHRATVLLDTVDDRLQVVLDGAVVMDLQDVDFTMAAPGASGSYASGWTIGTAWNRFFDGEVHDFRLGDQFSFLEDYQPVPTALLS